METLVKFEIPGGFQTRCYNCNPDGKPELPKEMLDAVSEGKIDIINDYLDKSGDVNSCYEEECLLFRACAEGQVEILKILLNCPDIHLNNACKGDKAFDIAFKNGHMECVRLLIDSRSECTLKLHNSWKKVAKFLQAQPSFNCRSAVQLLEFATEDNSWDVVKILLNSEHHFIQETLYTVLKNAVHQSRWDIVMCVAKREFYGKMRIVNEALALAVNLRQWDVAKELLHIIGNDLKFDLDFVETAFSGKAAEVQRLLKEGKYDNGTMNGNFLVISALGVNDAVANVLMSVRNVYARTTFSYALFLSSFCCCIELMIKILHHPEASITVNDLHRAGDVLLFHPRCEETNDFIMDQFNQYNLNEAWKN